ncbi:hypothetical protein [Mucilaginibacter antarcticus]|uniref:hypothetical protein n=1 Tax=Mucilaginibacter antarcticus TaxID=1855725 RepID=UPI003630CE66
MKFELENIDIHCTTIGPGWLETCEPVSAVQMEKIKIALQKAGLELIDDKKTILIEKIKHAVLEIFSKPDTILKTNFSYYLSQKLNLDYTYLANVFSETQGSTIENFVITNRIKK